MRTNGHNCQHWLALLLITAATIVSTTLESNARDEAAKDDDTVLDGFIQERSYSELARQLLSAKLVPSERDYFQAILDDRTNHPEHAAAELEKILPELKKTSAQRAAVALETLAYDYFDLGHYADAGDTLSVLLKDFAAELSPAAKQNITNDRNTFELLRGAPFQTISGARNFKVAVQRDPINDIDVPIGVGSKTQWWIFDTGANITTISRSSAKQLGLTLSKGHASTQSGATGNQVSLSTTVVPELHFGSAVLHNVVSLVMDDKALDVDLGKNGHYRIQGILGYPALAALGSFTMSGNEMTVSPEAQPSTGSAKLYIEGLTPLVEATVEGKELLFQFDTGQSGAELSAKYVRTFPQQFASLKAVNAGIGGAGGVRSLTAYPLPELVLHLGTAAAIFSNVTAVSQDRGVYPQDEFFGNVGQGLLQQFRTYTIDFTRMQLALGERAQ
jgi:predicted aspartyl protease